MLDDQNHRSPGDGLGRQMRANLSPSQQAESSASPIASTSRIPDDGDLVWPNKRLLRTDEPSSAAQKIGIRRRAYSEELHRKPAERSETNIQQGLRRRGSLAAETSSRSDDMLSNSLSFTPENPPTDPFEAIGSHAGLSHDDRSHAVALALANQAPSPPRRRQLRERKAAQLAPYTTEMQRYQRRLIRNDWEDAVVKNRYLERASHLRRKEQESLKEVPAQAPGTTMESNTTVASPPSAQQLDKASKRKRKKDIAVQPLTKDARDERAIGLDYSSDEETPSPGDRDELAFSVDPQASLEIPINPAMRKRHRVVSDSEESTVSSTVSMSSPLDRGKHGVDARELDLSITSSDSPDRSVTTAKELRLIRAETTSTAHQRDYDKLLKMLKRTMPARMARDYIEDLKAMDKEVESPVQSRIESDHGDMSATSDVENIIRPGEARRIVRGNEERASGRFALVGDSEDDSESSSSSTHAHSLLDTWHESDVDEGAVPRRRPLEPRNSFQTWSPKSRNRLDPVSNIARTRNDYLPPRRSRASRDEEDDIDRMLTGHRHRSGPPRKKRIGHADPRREDTINNRSKVRSKTNRGRASTLSTSARKASYGNSSTSISFLRAPRAVSETKLRRDLDTSEVSSLFDTELCVRVAGSESKSSGRKSDFEQKTAMKITQRARSSIDEMDVSKPYERSDLADFVEDECHNEAPKDAAVATNTSFEAPRRLLNGKLAFKPSIINSHQSDALKDPDSGLSQVYREQLEELAAWQWAGPFSISFNIRKPVGGIRCDPDGFIGKGRLYAMLHPVPLSGEVSPVHPTELDFNRAFYEDVGFEDILNKILTGESSESQVERGEEGRVTECSLKRRLDEYSRFIADSARNPVHARQVAKKVKLTIDHAPSQMQSLPHSQRFAILSCLHQSHVDLLWRVLCSDPASPSGTEELDLEDVKDNLLQASQEMMVNLLIHGLHRTVGSINKSDRDPDAITDVADTSLEQWLILIHLLSSDLGKALSHSTMSTFWVVFEAALAQYHGALRRSKPALIVAENMWYSIFAITLLGHFTATTGSFSARSALHEPPWSFVVRAIEIVRLRFDDQVEASASLKSLQRRDEYIRTLIRRTLQLVQIWQRPLYGAESMLAKIYSLFDTHRLEDLPSEENHDFAPFLNHFDDHLLFSTTEEAEDSTGFHLFLRLLALSARQARDSSNDSLSSGEKAASRLFSRFSPVRRMDFSKTNVPTSLQRSALYNHYSIALVYLYIVPTTQHQRLLQIQQYLRVEQADTKSQTVAIRAIMYAIIILRQHGRPIESAFGWFKATFASLVRNLEELQRQGSGGAGNQLRWERSVRDQTTIILVALRSVQYGMRTSSLQANAHHACQVDREYVSSSWTIKLFEPTFASQNPSVTLESLRLLQCFLSLRQAKRSMTTQKDVTMTNGESQDSYGDLFDEFDFDDADLLQVAGYIPDGQSSEQPTRSKQGSYEESPKDEELLQFLHEGISPALFKLLSFLAQPSNAAAYGLCATPSTSILPSAYGSLQRDGIDGVHRHVSALLERSSRSLVGPLVVQCWAACANILVKEAAMRQWAYYVRHGAEDPRHLLDDDARKQVLIDFFLSVTCRKTDESLRLSTSEREAYKANVVEIWTLLFSLIALPVLPMRFSLFFVAIVEHEQLRSDPCERLTNKLTFDACREEEVEEQLGSATSRQNVLEALLQGAANVAHCDPSQRFAVTCSISGLLSSLRLLLREQASGKENIGRQQHWLRLIEMCRSLLPADTLRGLTLELQRTAERLSHHDPLRSSQPF